MSNIFGLSVLDIFTNVEGDNVCQSHIKSVVQGLKNQDLWSLQMLDASTKIPNGILTGNLVDFGNYDECLQIVSPNKEFSGKHCQASLPFPDLNATKINDALDVQLSLRWSYCLPSTCSTAEVQDFLNKSFFPILGKNVNVSEGACNTREDKEFSGVDIFSISFFSVIVAIAIASTIYDLLQTSKSHDLLRTFSLYTNGKRLLSVRSSSDSLQSLNGIRFLSMVWIILGHRYFFASQLPYLNLLELATYPTLIDAQLILGAVLAVDTFFLLSGLLNAYHLLRVLDSTNTFPTVKYFFHRYIRTTPALAAMIFIYATWYIYIGNGPMWNTISQINKQLCVDNWWPTLLYINNYYNPISQCAGQSWYLAVDMQLYWISPLVIIPCWKWPRIQKYFLGFLLLLSTAALFAVSYVDKIRMAFTFTQDLEEYQRITEDVYVPTHMRATPYLMGIMLGIFLNNMKKEGNKLKLTKWEVITGWLASASLCLIVVLGNYPFVQSEQDHPFNGLESSFYISLHSIAWSCGIGWVVVACHFGYGGLVNDILSWKVFTSLSRLTYCMFITQLGVQQYYMGITRTPSYFTTFNQVYNFLGDLGMILIASCLLCLLFESPIMMIEKYFQTPKRKSSVLRAGNTNEGYVQEKEV